ncbi:MAG: sugar-binding protein, partial [Pseudomonadaceae bacterium]|nr:sugar-binding protein [Pseudomonadaceae bacterium]
PTGAHDAYNKGDKVIFEGEVYESTIDNNTWSPTDYPSSWKFPE